MPGRCSKDVQPLWREPIGHASVGWVMLVLLPSCLCEAHLAAGSREADSWLLVGKSLLCPDVNGSTILYACSLHDSGNFMMSATLQRSLQAAEDPKKKVKHIKDLWATLKLLRISPQDQNFGPDERRVVEEILSASTKVHEKQRQGFEEPWALLNRCCPPMAYTPSERPFPTCLLHGPNSTTQVGASSANM